MRYGPFSVCLLAAATAFGCNRDPEWSVALVSSKLGAAGYAVSSASNPGIGAAGIVGVDCLNAARGGAVDMLCVVRCASAQACSAFAEGTWESYGTFRRGPTLLVHQVCGRPTGYPLSFDCTAVRSALGL